ncbi:MAG: glycosyltransferase family 2 protein [Fusobacteriaceae bacterium]
MKLKTKYTQGIYMEEINIIIPTFKPQKYLMKCLNSIENQTMEKTRYLVTIVLNGEKNPYYYFIMNELSKFTFKFLVIYTNKVGVSNARNIGIEKSYSDYILFIDDDDYISDNFLENLYSKTNFDKNRIIVSNTKCRDEMNNEYFDYLGKNFFKYNQKKNKNIFLLRKQISNSCGKLIPRKLINDIRFNTSLEIGEDSVFMNNILADNAIKSIEFSAQDVFYYRNVRRDSSTNKKRTKIKNIKLKFLLIREYLKLLKFSKNNKLITISRIVATFKK